MLTNEHWFHGDIVWEMFRSFAIEFFFFGPDDTDFVAVFLIFRYHESWKDWRRTEEKTDWVILVSPKCFSLEKKSIFILALPFNWDIENMFRISLSDTGECVQVQRPTHHYIRWARVRVYYIIALSICHRTVVNLKCLRMHLKAVAATRTPSNCPDVSIKQSFFFHICTVCAVCAPFVQCHTLSMGTECRWMLMMPWNYWVIITISVCTVAFVCL